jgi:hypothetical protein
MSETRIDDCLSNRDGVLFIEGMASPDLIERFGSPLFVFSEDQIRRNVRRFRNAFEKGWTAGPVKVMPAAKANWVFAIQRVLADEGCGADIYSAGELDVALRAGVEPRFISTNGVPKDKEHIRQTIEVGARLTIDSLRDVEFLEELAPTLSKTAYVRLRIRPAISEFVKKSDFSPDGMVPTDLVRTSRSWASTRTTDDTIDRPSTGKRRCTPMRGTSDGCVKLSTVSGWKRSASAAGLRFQETPTTRRRITATRSYSALFIGCPSG